MNDWYKNILRDIENDADDVVHERVTRDLTQRSGDWNEVTITDLFFNEDGTFTGVVSENGNTRYVEGE